MILSRGTPEERARIVEKFVDVGKVCKRGVERPRATETYDGFNQIFFF